MGELPFSSSPLALS
jgi:hypothetical protein